MIVNECFGLNYKTVRETINLYPVISVVLKKKSINYLAHAYLSFNDPGFLAGNLISDFVKGKSRYQYPPDIQKGITLHRAIDTFTDEHIATREAKKIFQPHYRLYSGAFIDVVYDHFLAIDVNEFPGKSLLDFSQNVYSQLNNLTGYMPERFANMYPYMKSQNWLYNYSTVKGIEQSMQGVVRRAAYLTESKVAYQLFTEHYQLLKGYYRQFWADMKPFALREYEILKKWDIP